MTAQPTHKQSSEKQASARELAHTRYNASRYAAQSSRRRRARRSGKAVLAVVLVVIVAVVGVGVFAVQRSGTGDDDAVEAEEDEEIVDDKGVFATIGSSLPLQESVSTPTPIMAESEGLELHCAVACEDLTEILIHNASYDYAYPITTQLTEATNTEVQKNHGTGRDASEQPTGDEWMTGEFIRCYRSGNGGPTMSAIDCGGEAGTTVYAPVSGTVVLVKKYKLYDLYDDYQIHIQPEGREDLDVVLIHLENPCVEAGDTVEAGVTEIAEIRDVYAYIGESMQLKDYTAEDDNGNHTHIQVNNVNSKKYHGLDDLEEGGSSDAKKED